MDRAVNIHSTDRQAGLAGQTGRRSELVTEAVQFLIRSDLLTVN